jgi:hypothetical protein
MATDDRAVQPLAKPVERSPEAPTTEAGRELHLAIAKNERLSLNGQRMREYHNAILAIEAEARAASERGPQERPQPPDNEVEACRHCPTPDVHPTRIGGILIYESNYDTTILEGYSAEVAQERPQPDYEQINGVTYERRADGRLHLPGVAQERPPIDVTALHYAMCESPWIAPFVHDAEYPGEWPCSDVAARLAGGSVASPEPRP